MVFGAGKAERLTRIGTSRGDDIRRDMYLGVHSDMRDMPRIHAVMDCLVEDIASQREMLDPDGQ